MTFFSLRVFMSRILSTSFGSMKGPFFNERDIYLCSSGRFAATTPAHDQLGRRLLLSTSLHAFRLAPGRDRRTATRSLAFTAAQRVIDRVHGHAPHLGTLAAPAVGTGFTNHLQLVVGVADFTDGRQAFLADHTYF